jgi:hypothetical protein
MRPEIFHRASFHGALARRTHTIGSWRKLYPDRAKVLYSTNFASKSDFVSALEIDSTRPTYVFARSRRTLPCKKGTIPCHIALFQPVISLA